MADLNAVQLVGRLTRDPELKVLSSGTSVCGMRLAVNGSKKDASGNYAEQAHFFDVAIYGKQAENVAKFMAKGSQVAVNGRLEYREWEAEGGGKRSRVEVIAQQVQFLGSKNGGDPDPRSPASPVEDDSDIPF